MAFTKDGFKKWIAAGAPGDDAYALLANGGHKKITDWLTDLSSNTTNAVSITVGGTTKTIAVSTMKTSLGLGARAYDSTSYLPLSGGKMTGQITKDGQSVAWVNGRSGAALRETSTDGYHTLWSLKTTNGSWDFGEYSTSGYYDIPLLTYITDTNFNAGTNSSTYQIKFPLDSGTVALTKNIPSSLKNPYALTTFGVSYDGSAAKTVDKTTFISTLEEGTSTVTDGTMFVTSYASNNGFADTNAVNTPYKRKASRLYDYIKAKTDTLYSASGHNHDSSYVTALGTNSFGQLTWTKNGSVNCIVVPYATKAGCDGSGNYISSTYLPVQRIANPAASSTEVGITPFNVLAYKSAGFPMYTDPEFAEGTNYVNVYNNKGGTDVTITRGTSTSFGLNDSGNASDYVLKIQTAGTNVTPGWGGFYQAINSRANAVYVQIFRAKLPSGYYLQTASNSMGDNYSDKFITSNAGTGKWEWYGRIVHCGATGTFSSGGHIYVYSGTTPSASAPLVWYLSYCNCISLAFPSYDGLRTRYCDFAINANYASYDAEGNTINTTYFNKNIFNDVIETTQFEKAVTCKGNINVAGSDNMITGVNGTKVVMPDYRVSTSASNIAPKLTGTTKQGYAVLNLTDQASSSQSDVFISGVRTPIANTDAANKKYVDDSLGAYLPLTGGTLTGLLTTTSGSTHSGIKVGDTYISASGRDLILQNNNSIRFGDEDIWNADAWAGLKYVHSLNTIYLGIADGAQFSADASQSDGTLAFPGITTIDFSDKTLDLGNTALLYSWCDEEYDRNQVELTFDTEDGNGTGTFRVKCDTVLGSIPIIEVEGNYGDDSSIFEVLTSAGGTIEGSLSIVTGDGGVGNLSVGNKLTVSGTITSSSTITASGSMYAAHFYESSDIRLKNVEHYLEIPIEKLASLPIFDFTWKNENKQLNSGTSAQAVQQVLPNVVSGEESLTVDYGILGTITGISACRELVKHEDEIQELKAKVIELEEKLKKYESKL